MTASMCARRRTEIDKCCFYLNVSQNRLIPNSDIKVRMPTKMQPVQTQTSVSWVPAYFGFLLGIIAMIVGLRFDQMAGIILFIITMVVFAIQVIFFVLHITGTRRGYLADMQ